MVMKHCNQYVQMAGLLFVLSCSQGSTGQPAAGSSSSATATGSSSGGGLPSGATSGGPTTGSSSGAPVETGGSQDASASEDATNAYDDASAPQLDAREATADSAPNNKVLIYGVTTPGAYRHASIPVAADAIARAAAAAGLTTEAVGTTGATNVVDATKFTAGSLAQYGAVILLANDGEPFGYPATQEIQNLADYVQQGGALVAVECATDCYGGAYSGPIYNHPPSARYHALLGATMNNHSNFAPATCTPIGSHVSVAQLPATFHVTDEIYNFLGFAPDNQVVMTCISSDNPQLVKPIAWYREVGAGRYFYTALGHPPESWLMPMDPAKPNSRLVENHILPGLLWAMKR
jgi:type 1 glutamine amidotransferase